MTREFKSFLVRLVKFGPIYCHCCPNGISNRTASCITFRRIGKPKKTPAGRYPVTEMFSCELCGKIAFHIHSAAELKTFYEVKKCRK